MHAVTVQVVEGGKRQVGLRRERLIVCRWGSNGRYLSVSRAGQATRQLGPAPIGLRPGATLMGVLAWDDARQRQACFLLIPRRPASVSLAGHLVEARGFVVLERPRARLTLAGTYRLGRSKAAQRQVARQRPWHGEFFAGHD